MHTQNYGITLYIIISITFLCSSTIFAAAKRPKPSSWDIEREQRAITASVFGIDPQFPLWTREAAQECCSLLKKSCPNSPLQKEVLTQIGLSCEGTVPEGGAPLPPFFDLLCAIVAHTPNPSNTPPALKAALVLKDTGFDRRTFDKYCTLWGANFGRSQMWLREISASFEKEVGPVRQLLAQIENLRSCIVIPGPQTYSSVWLKNFDESRFLCVAKNPLETPLPPEAEEIENGLYCIPSHALNPAIWQYQRDQACRQLGLPLGTIVWPEDNAQSFATEIATIMDSAQGTANPQKQTPVQNFLNHLREQCQYCTPNGKPLCNLKKARNPECIRKNADLFLQILHKLGLKNDGTPMPGTRVPCVAFVLYAKAIARIASCGHGDPKRSVEVQVVGGLLGYRGAPTVRTILPFYTQTSGFDLKSVDANRFANYMRWRIEKSTKFTQSLYGNYVILPPWPNDDDDSSSKN